MLLVSAACCRLVCFCPSPSHPTAPPMVDIASVCCLLSFSLLLSQPSHPTTPPMVDVASVCCLLSFGLFCPSPSHPTIPPINRVAIECNWRFVSPGFIFQWWCNKSSFVRICEVSCVYMWVRFRCECEIIFVYMWVLASSVCTCELDLRANLSKGDKKVLCVYICVRGWVLDRFLRFKYFACQLIWDSNDLVVNWCVIQSWLSIGLRFNCFGCQMIWGSSDLVVNWFGIQASRRFPFLRDSLQNEALKLKNEAFVRDFLQKWSFAAQKRSFCVRLPSSSLKIEAIWSFEAEREPFLRDFLQKSSFLQKWNFEAQKRSFSVRLPSKMTCWPDTWPQNSNTF